MPAPWIRLSLAEFTKVLADFRFTRKINQVHMHHTWKPDHGAFRAQGGKKLVEGMWKHHTQVNGWSDIAQHISIDPDGFIWTGRNWNHAPASASGFNGNSQKGPFMFEMIGNFDRNRDRFTDPQRDTVLNVIALVQKRFNLPAESLHFHREMSTKTCPGNGIDYNETLEAVRQIHARGVLAAVAGAGAAAVMRGADEERPELFPEEAEHASSVVREALRVLGQEGARGAVADLGEAELKEEEDTFPGIVRDATRDAPDGLTPETLASLRPHVINMVQGRFSDDGRFATSPGDIDAIFQQHIPAWMAETKGPLKIVFWAHGGLVSESSALQRAAIQVPWWLENGVYPIYFVWETGLFETLGQLLRASQQKGARDIYDMTADPMVEAVTRALKGPMIWSGMKRSAERASDAEGVARYAAKQLAALLKTSGAAKRIEVHAVGHSAGAIFHSYFLPAALDEGLKSVSTAHFLAPAVRVDTFQKHLASHIGKKVGKLAIFTMKKDLERADNCMRVYRKSLLYLIHHALEAERQAPLLGLEISLRSDAALKKLFGLNGTPNPATEVVWSTTAEAEGTSASGATSHGGFDNDRATMNSLARRVSGADDIKEYPDEGARALATSDEWADQADWPEALRERLTDMPAPTHVYAAGGEFEGSSPAANGRATGARRALCVGIDDYKRNRLNGCVADAKMWAATLQGRGFQPPTVLLNAKATRAAILEELTALVGTSKAGDVVVFQFAGHGTQLPDVSGDEKGGDTPQQDEALCSYDFTEGAFVIDDDIRAVFKNIPNGVNVTCFIDCCHSGTISRFAVGGPDADGTADERPRFITADDEMKNAHRRFRQARGIPDGGRTRSTPTMREVVFSACLSSEVAWEKDGHGEFTVRATEVLKRNSSLTHEQFLQKVVSAFGSAPRQHPQLDASVAGRSGILLQATGGRTEAGAELADVQLDGGRDRSQSVKKLLIDIADLL